MLRLTPPRPARAARPPSPRTTIDGGKSWQLPSDWSTIGVNEVVPSPGTGGSGEFTALGYGTSHTSPNTTAAQIGWRGRLTAAGDIVKLKAGIKITYSIAGVTPATAFPAVLVHSGSVIALTDGTHLTTLYGHGAGVYRRWDRRPTVYFAKSHGANGTRWSIVSQINWQAEMGANSDGPGEPSTARLADGRM